MLKFAACTLSANAMPCAGIFTDTGRLTVLIGNTADLATRQNQRHHHERGSGEELRDNVAVHVGESKIPTLEAERELLVVDAEEVHDRRVDVVHMGAIFD
jgi:hypothetical protein